MNTAIFTVDKKNNRVKASNDNAAFQLYNESVVSGDCVKPMKPDTWYPINGDYGYWVLENEFPTHKGNQFITVEYI